MRIRPATSDDTARLAELNRLFNGVDAGFPLVDDGSERVLIAEIGHEVVGFACVQVSRSACYDAPWAELTELFVEDASRRRGVGSALVAEAQQLAWSEGCHELVARTRVNNRGARALLGKSRFEQAQHVVFRKRRGT